MNGEIDITMWEYSLKLDRTTAYNGDTILAANSDKFTSRFMVGDEVFSVHEHVT